MKAPKEEPAKPETDQKEEQPAGKRKIVMAAWSPHDLRRTAATKLSELGHTDEIIESVLNHKKKGIVATYNRNRYDREKQAALEAWERARLSPSPRRRARSKAV